MIIFFENGRLGNQLFQYAVLKKLYANHRLVFFGCGVLKHALASVDAIIIEKEKVPRWLMFGLKQLFLLLTNLRMIGVIQESRGNDGYAVRHNWGILFGIYLLKPSFFQHEIMLEKFNPDLRIHDDHLRMGSEWLNTKIDKLSVEKLVFIHIRRGDYLTWPNREYPAVLDKKFYTKAMGRMREMIKNPIFILLTDDPHYAKDCFGDEASILISENDLLVDLAIMSMCQHGILSASSFAWWGAWFSRSYSENTGIYMAIKFWVGHRKKEWKPEGFITNWITYIE
jgi:hypothetical protein